MVFVEKWNHHSLAGPNTSDQSPLELCFLGQSTEGIYADDLYADVHLTILSQYLDTYSHPIVPSPYQTSAGHPDDEEVSEDDNDLEWEDEDVLLEELENSISGHVQSNI
ncbi:hypothetical protein BDY19DRAFT_994574 [Irpex rosettiformis]|uniref:Uncharacterized protein n=1 Tax=Irpex rosettiformis TaxID=378272 RepID=A0ACB8U0C8_9APHY|nr:hypothetical protein BDY19DRAFT_994574 [Irpex rosettiformis]